MAAGDLESAYLAIIAGERRGALAACARAVLALLALGFAVLVRARAALYALGVARATRVPCPVVSVGNLTAGGTGKTPVVEHLARELRRRGLRPAIVSRGYGRGADGAPNDEARVLAARLPEAPHVQDRDRVRGARAAIERHGATALVLDDGFQHRRLARDLDVVLVDATRPFGYGWLLPRGLLREPPGALRRADVVVITRADLADAPALEALRARLARLAPGVPVAEVVFAPAGLRPLGAPLQGEVAGEARAAAASALAGRAVLACAGIGNPEAFTRTLEGLGARVAGALAFPDHHAYAQADLARIATAARAAGAEWVVTTHKDEVKLAPLVQAARVGAQAAAGAAGAGGAPPLDVRVLDIEVEVVRGGADLDAVLDARLGRAAERAA